MTKDLFRIGVNTSAQIAARSVTAVSTLIVTLLVTRNLSQSDWGIFVTITSYVALFYLIADFGLNGVVVRELEERKKEIKKRKEELVLSYDIRDSVNDYKKLIERIK